MPRNLWEEIYAIEIFPNGTTLAQITANDPVLNGTSTYGIKSLLGTSAIYNLLVDGDHPMIPPQAANVEKSLATGKSIGNIVEITPVTRKPEPLVLPEVFNAHNLTAFFKLWGHTGCSVANGTTNTALQILTVVPYTNTEPWQYGNVVKFMQSSGGSDEVDQALKGCIVKRITIRGEEGGVIEGDVEFMGAMYDQANLAGVAGTGRLAKSKPFDTIVPLKFEDAIVKLGGQSISIPKFEITFENNAVMHYYNEIAAKIVNLGKIEVTGTITVPWNESTTEGKNQQINDYVNGVDKVFELIWGNATTGVDTLTDNAKNKVANNYFSVAVNIKLTGVTQNDIDGLPMLESTFKALEDEVSTVNTLTVKTGYLKSGNTWV